MSRYQFMDKTMEMLQSELAPDACIAMEIEGRWVEEMAYYLSTYAMEEHERICILGSYVLLRLACQCHEGLRADEEQLTKRILDGDYLQSLYYQFATRFQQFELLSAIAPVHKKVHIRRVEGKSADYLLQTAFQKYVARRYTQVAYEVI